MWGQGKLKKEAQTWVRIIPMRVGTRRYGANPVRLAEDHPHACGDKLIISAVACDRRGSSPCVWGQVLRFPYNQPFTRIIPMRVGTSACNRLRTYPTMDHPHACGDKTVPLSNTNCRRGSSPCVWGQVAQTVKSASTSWDHPHACGDKTASLLS